MIHVLAAKQAPNLSAMATAAKQVCRQARQFSSHRTQWLSIRQSTLSSTTRRTFSNSPMFQAEEPSETTSDSSSSSSSEPYFNKSFFRKLDKDDQAQYRTFTADERRRMERVSDSLRDEFSTDSRTHRELDDAIRAAMLEVEQEYPEELAEREPRNDGFFQMGEKEDIGPDDEFNADDISSTAHGELEQTREIREYARNAAWEMPLLAKLAQPFNPPTSATPLRFRYTTYLGEAHPAAKKVVVEFDPSDLSLSPSQTLKLIKLLGPRYNPTTKIAKMSTEAYESQAQNKRYLGDTISALLKEAKDPSADAFADVPLDFRHQKPKPKLRFPERWLLTEERKRELEAKRAAMVQDEARRAGLVEGLVDGIKEIEEGRKIDNLQKVEAPIMAEAKEPLAKGKMGKKQMGQKAR